MVPAVQKDAYKSIGDGHGFYSPKEAINSEEVPHSSSLRQYDGGELSELSGFGQINSPEQLGPEHSPSVGKEEVLSNNLSYCRSEECGSGWIVKRQTTLVGVVAGFGNLPADLPAGLSSQSGSLRDQREPQAYVLCVSSARRSGGGSGLVFTKLERLGGSVSFSSVISDPQSPSNVGDLPGPSNALNTRVASSALVSSVITESTFSSADSSFSTLSSSRQRAYLLLVKQSQPPSIVDFLKEVFTDQYSEANAEIYLKVLHV